MNIIAFSPPLGYWAADIDIEKGDSISTPCIAVVTWALLDIPLDQPGSPGIEPIVSYQGAIIAWNQIPGAVSYAVSPIDRDEWVTLVRKWAGKGQ